MSGKPPALINSSALSFRVFGEDITPAAQKSMEVKRSTSVGENAKSGLDGDAANSELGEEEDAASPADEMK
jgi:hypothetical protein